MKSKYVMTELQIESLAHDVATAQGTVRAGGVTFLRVLVTECQAKLGRVKRGRTSAETQINVLTDAYARYYAAVLRGVVTPDVAHVAGLEASEASRRALERNRRSTFARSSKSVLLSWIRAGGDMRTLDAETVTRDPLAAEARKARGGSETTHQIERHMSGIARLVMAEARGGDPDAARTEVERCLDELQRVLDELSANGNTEPEPTITTVLRSKPAHTRIPAPTQRMHS